MPIEKEKTMEKINQTREVEYNRAKLWQIILFSLNNTSTNIYLFAFGFVTYFATGILGLAVLFVSQIMGYIRIFDGVIDPAIGVLIDKTNMRFGKYRPNIVIGNIISILSFLLLFNIDYFGKELAMPLFIIALIIHKIGYSLQATVTKAGQAALTNDPKQRPIFNIFDGIATSILFSGGQMIVSSFLVVKYGGFTHAFFGAFIPGVMVISSVLALLACVGIWSKDNIAFFGIGEKTKETSLRDYWFVLKGNRPLQMLATAAAFVKFVVQIFSDQVMMIMIFGIVFGNYGLSGTISMILIFTGIAFTVLAAALARKKGLRFAYITYVQVAIISIVVLAILLFIGQPGSLRFDQINIFTILFVLTYAVARGTSQAPAGLALTMSADISDYETSVSGRFVSGLIGTIFSLTDSIASSLVPMVIGFVLAMIGFSQEYPTQNTLLTPELRMMTVLLAAGLPLLMLICSLVFMKFYKLDSQTMVEIQEKIQVMKAAKDKQRAIDIANNVPLSDMEFINVSDYKVDHHVKK